MTTQPQGALAPIVIDQSTALTPIFYRDQPVITLAMMDQVHARPEGTARKRYNDHKTKLVEGEDYFVRNSDEAAVMGLTAPNGLTLLTETGYLMLVKSFTDPLAWQVQRQLVKGYFRRAAPSPDTISPQQFNEITRRVHTIGHLFHYSDSARWAVYKRLRDGLGVDFVHKIPASQHEAALKLLCGMERAATDFRSSVMDAEKRFFKQTLRLGQDTNFDAIRALPANR